jgi:hypothetical protein
MRDTLWAIFASVHVLFVLVLSMPRAMVEPHDLAKEEVQSWFDDRTAQLHDLGFEVSKDDLVAQAVWWGGGYEWVRWSIAYPGNRYARSTGARQSWRMFGDVPQSSAFLFIEALHGDDWTPIHIARDDEANWRRGFFDQERPRTFINQFTRRKNRKAWNRFVVWAGAELQADFPEVKRFRVGMQEVHFPATEDLPEHPEHRLGDRYWVTPFPKEVSQ